MTDNIEQVDINHEPIELCKILKIANLVGGGGEAKMLIAEGYVVLNGEPEYQKRKKIYHGDIIEFNGEIIQAKLNLPASEQIVPEQTVIEQAGIEPKNAVSSRKKNKAKNKAAHKKTKNKSTVKNVSSLDIENKAIRKPISF